MFICCRLKCTAHRASIAIKAVVGLKLFSLLLAKRFRHALERLADVHTVLDVAYRISSIEAPGLY